MYVTPNVTGTVQKTHNFCFIYFCLFVDIQRLGIKRSLHGEQAVMRRIHNLFQVFRESGWHLVSCTSTQYSTGINM